MFGRPGGGSFADGVTRVAYSEADLAGRAYVIGLMRAAGVTPRVDPAGNIFAQRPGTDPSLAPILFGSHIDSVPSGGNFDGDLGTLASIGVLDAFDRGERAHAPSARRSSSGPPRKASPSTAASPAAASSRATSRRTTWNRCGTACGARMRSARSAATPTASWRRGGRRARGTAISSCTSSKEARSNGRTTADRRRPGDRGDRAVRSEDHRVCQPRRHDADGRAAGCNDRGGAADAGGQRGGDPQAGTAGRHRRQDRGNARTRRTSCPAQPR